MRRWVTGSALDRAEACPGSTVLPTGPDKESYAARYGRKVHDDLEQGREVPGVDPSWYPPGGLHEVQVYFDPAAARGGIHLGHRARDYSWAPPRFIVGTCDYLHRGLRMVDDLKTGLVLPALDTLQLGLGAVALHDEEGPGDILISITSVPRGFVDAAKRYQQRLLSLDVDLFRERLVALRRAHLLDLEVHHAGMEPTLQPGPHCKYCRALACDRRQT